MSLYTVFFIALAFLRNPLWALLVVGAVAWLGTGWWRGAVPNPFRLFQDRFRARELRGLLSISPHDIRARAELGALIYRRAPAEAVEVLKPVIERSPEIPHAAWHYGVALMKTGELAEGRRQVERGLSLRKDLGYGRPMVEVGDVLLGRGDAAGARAAYEAATAVHSSFAEGWYKAGMAALAAGDRAGARAHFEEALASTRHAPAFKRKVDRQWRLRAWWALRTRV